MIVITICILLLVSYIFDLTAAKTRMPTVIILLILGWSMKYLSSYLRLDIADMTPLLPNLGTIGLILIVLEGSLELELDKSKKGLVSRSFRMALLSIVLNAAGIAGFFYFADKSDIRNFFINAIPLCVISSAIAIPSAQYFQQKEKEFVIYESSFSDILGVLFFNFLAGNEIYNIRSLGSFSAQLLVIVVISFLATAALAILLKKITHHIKFAPIILLVILIYYVSKIFHLPGLIFIMFFGLFLGNINKLNRYKLIQKLDPRSLDHEVDKFKELTAEAAFLIRSLFFLTFGFLIKTEEILNPESILWASIIVAILLVIRLSLLKIHRMPVKPYFFIAPRGLITILLFMSIAPEKRIELINDSVITQVILITALLMMFGTMGAKKKTSS